MPTRRRRERARKKRRILVRRLSVYLLLPLAAFCLAQAFKTDGRPELPPVLGPEAFTPHAEFRTTDRIGTLFKATLVRPPWGTAPEDFAAEMRAVAARAQAAGYETLVVVAPDGTTLASGPVEEPLVALPEHEGS